MLQLLCHGDRPCLFISRASPSSAATAQRIHRLWSLLFLIDLISGSSSGALIYVTSADRVHINAYSTCRSDCAHVSDCSSKRTTSDSIRSVSWRTYAACKCPREHHCRISADRCERSSPCPRVRESTSSTPAVSAALSFMGSFPHSNAPRHASTCVCRCTASRRPPDWQRWRRKWRAKQPPTRGRFFTCSGC